MQSIIQLDNIEKRVKDGEKSLSILNQLSLNVASGDMLSIMGKSGSGKTTLLNILSLLDNQFEGKYNFQGTEINLASKKQKFQLRLEKIGNIFQDFQLIPELNVIQNVEVPLGYRGVKKRERIELAKEALGLVGLSGKEQQHIQHLSGGEQQRVAIARGIVFKPQILLADEPTGNLDAVTSKEIMDLLVRLNEEELMTILVVTHDEEVASRCKKHLWLTEGRLRSVSIGI